MPDNNIIIGKPKTFKFGKGKGDIKKSFETTFNPANEIVEQKVTKYDREGKIKKQIYIKPPLSAKSPYMMYDEKSGVMMSESPIMRKCGYKRHKKSGLKMEDGEKLKLTILSDTDKGEQVKYKGRTVTVKGDTVTKGGDVVGYVSKKTGKIGKL